MWRLFNTLCIIFILVFSTGIWWAWRGVATASAPAGVHLEEPTVMITPTTLPAESSSPVEKEIEEFAIAPRPAEKTLSATPARMNLDVPFTSQAPEKNWDQPWQDACEEAALLMLDAYYSGYGLSPYFARDELLKMVAWEEDRGWDRSISIEKIQQTYNEFFVGASVKRKKATVVIDPSIEFIKKSIAAGNPVLAVADGKVLPNPHFRNGGPEYHALIIRGYTGTSFITNDPGTQFGENFVYAYDDLMRAVRDWNDGEVKTGRRAVLVIQ